MTTITFDTLAFSKKLQESGMPRAQAEAFASAQKEAFDEMIQTKELATKKDIADVKLEMEKLKHDLLKWQIGIGFALVVIMAKGFGWLSF